MHLDEKGFSEEFLNTAWKSVKNVDIAADVIAFIRTLSLVTDLVFPELLIKSAIDKIKRKKDWNKIQLK